MKPGFKRVAVFTALAVLAIPIANSGTGTLTTACGSTVKDNCFGKCMVTYEKYICGPSVKPGEVAKHKKELHECQQACKTS